MDRKGQILTASLPVLVRYGYRKTTMDDLARAAGLSRQALYNVFKSKGALFEALVRHHTAAGLEAVEAALARPGLTLAERVTDACDAWFGPHVEALRASPHGGTVVSELCEAAGESLSTTQNRVVERLTDALRQSTGEAASGRALTLYAACKGLVSMSPTREAFRIHVEVAVEAIVGRSR